MGKLVRPNEVGAIIFERTGYNLQPFPFGGESEAWTWFLGSFSIWSRNSAYTTALQYDRRSKLGPFTDADKDAVDFILSKRDNSDFEIYPSEGFARDGHPLPASFSFVNSSMLARDIRTARHDQLDGIKRALNTPDMNRFPDNSVGYLESRDDVLAYNCGVRALKLCDFTEGDEGLLRHGYLVKYTGRNGMRISAPGMI